MQIRVEVMTVSQSSHSPLTGTSETQPQLQLDCRTVPDHLRQSTPELDVDIDCLRPDMTLCNWHSRGDLELKFEYTKPTFRFSLQLSGAFESKAKGQNSLQRKINQVELRYLREPVSELISRRGDAHWIDLLLQPDFFPIALPGETELLPDMISQVLADRDLEVPGLCEDLMPDQIMAMQQIDHSLFEGACRTMYLKSKCLEILSLFFARHTFSKRADQRVSERDVALIHRVREILQESLVEQPTLAGLAQEVGLSESKIRRGFRALFDQSVFTYYRNYRMEYARQLLFDQQGNVSTVASAVGYTNVSHFSSAFARHHGIRPGDYLRQVRNDLASRERQQNS